MIYNFNQIPEKVIPHFKGGEQYARARVTGDDHVQMIYGTLEPGASIGIHEHTDDCEIVYCIAGRATVYMDGQTEYLNPGESHYCPKGHTHSMKNEGTENLVIFSVLPKQ